MNERIKELAEQANIRFGRMAILDGDPRGMARFVSYSEFEKFAELLIRECAGYVSGAAEVYTQEEQDACERAAVGLKNYFGVSND